jgi:hypothetical protein
VSGPDCQANGPEGHEVEDNCPGQRPSGAPTHRKPVPPSLIPVLPVPIGAPVGRDRHQSRPGCHPIASRCTANLSPRARCRCHRAPMGADLGQRCATPTPPAASCSLDHMKMMKNCRCSTRREHRKRKFQVPGFQGPGSLGNHRKGPDERRSNLQAVCGRMPANCSHDVWRTTQFTIGDRRSLARACAAGRASGPHSRARKGPLSVRACAPARVERVKPRRALSVSTQCETGRSWPCGRPENASGRPQKPEMRLGANSGSPWRSNGGNSRLKRSRDATGIKQNVES